MLKTSAVTYGRFDPSENKAVLTEELGRAKVSPKRGTVLVSRMNTLALVGASAYVPDDHPHLVLPDRLWELTPNAEDADGQWLHAMLSCPLMRTRILDIAAGTSGSMKNISREKFLQLRLRVPPLPEQKKIAAILSSVDAAIEATEAVIEQLQVVKKAMMAELLTRGIPGRHKKFKMTEIGEVPEDWEVVPLRELVMQMRRPVEVQGLTTYREIGVRSHGKGVFHKEPVAGKGIGTKRVFWVEPGCLVVNIVFAWEGAVAATSASESGMIASHRFPMVKPRPEILDLHFLRLLFQTPRGIELLGAFSPGGAGRNKTLNQGAFLGLEVPVPPPHEQQVVAGTIVSIEERLRRETTYSLSFRAAKAALMSVLLTGEVRVKPDEAAA